MAGRQRPLVLVADDDDETRKIVGVVLAGGDLDCVAVEDGDQALTCLREQRPDLVILDMVMPGMSGWAFLRHLDQIPDPPPVVIVSGRPTASRNLGKLERHVRAFVSKPFNMANLVQTCHRVLATAKVAPPPVERRRAARRSLLIQASLLSRSGSSLATGQISNLSLTGAEIFLEIPLAVGQILTLEIALPDGNEPLRLSAEVRWRDGSYLGLSFRDLSVEAVQRIKDSTTPPTSG